MSKINKFLALAFSLATMLFVTSCVDDDDFTVPEDLVPAVDTSTFGTKTTFDAVLSRYYDVVDTDEDGTISSEEEDNGANAVGTWEFDAPLYIEGYVVSSDASGNFFEEIIIQNTTDENDLSNDTRRGIKVEINVRDLSNFYNYGRKVYVRLNGLAVGKSNGVLTLGRANGNTLGQLEPFEYKDFVIRDQELATITPKEVTIGELAEEDENTLVQISDVQFIKNAVESTNTYAGQATDEFDGFRIIENCETGFKILLQTSTFADFKSYPLAPGRGTLSGIYSRDFGDDFSVLIVNNVETIDFSSEDRCDPMVIDCGTVPAVGANNLFSDDFQNESNNQLITGNGWTNFIELGTEGWEAYTQSGSNASQGRSARVRPANSNDPITFAWLITPAIDIATNTGVTVSFETSNSFSDGSELELLVSTDWDGTTEGVTAATWTTLPAAYIVEDDVFFGAWLASGNVDLDCIEGTTMHVAFKYTGNAQPGFDGVYELDNISIDAN